MGFRFDTNRGKNMEKKNIVVLGGSFAPATKAHIETIVKTCEALDAKGILVPSSDEYVSRKMHKENQAHAEFYASYKKCRCLALNAVLQEYDPDREYLSIDHCELNHKSRYTIETLDYLAKQNPGKQIHFIMGAEKLSVFRRWKTADLLLSRYPVVVCPCRDMDAKSEIHKWFPDNADRFIILEKSPDLENISSTAVRKLVSEKDYKEVEKLTSPVTAAFLKEYFED